MKKENKTHKNENPEELDAKDSKTEVNETAENSSQAQNELEAKLAEKTRQCEEYYSMLQRMAAEFDNYKKRTVKEKESLCSDTTGDVVSAFLPVVDSLERAIQSASKGDDKQALKEGIELVYRQLRDTMKNLGVEEIQSVGGKFDPQVHNAVMHIEDEALEENSVVEEFQKGYALNGKVIRHSMVKVAN